MSNSNKNISILEQMKNTIVPESQKMEQAKQLFGGVMGDINPNQLFGNKNLEKMKALIDVPPPQTQSAPRPARQRTPQPQQPLQNHYNDSLSAHISSFENGSYPVMQRERDYDDFDNIEETLDETLMGLDFEIAKKSRNSKRTEPEPNHFHPPQPLPQPVVSKPTVNKKFPDFNVMESFEQVNINQSFDNPNKHSLNSQYFEQAVAVNPQISMEDVLKIRDLLTPYFKEIFKEMLEEFKQSYKNETKAVLRELFNESKRK